MLVAQASGMLPGKDVVLAEVLACRVSRSEIFSQFFLVKVRKLQGRVGIGDHDAMRCSGWGCFEVYNDTIEFLWVTGFNQLSASVSLG